MILVAPEPINDVTEAASGSGIWPVVITAILAPLILKLAEHFLSKRTTAEKESKVASAEDRKLDAEIRDELRDDNLRYRERISELEEANRINEEERRKLRREARIWQDKFDKMESAYYDVYRHRQALDFELKMLRKEVDILKNQLEIRNLSERMLRETGEQP